MSTHTRLRYVEIHLIPKKFYPTLSYWERRGMDEDVYLVEKFMHLYEKGLYVPPITLDRSYNVIDGSHRLSALRMLRRKWVWAEII